MREHERQLAEAKARWEAERLHEEMRIARQIQQKLFPAAPLPLPGLDVAGASFPAEATGGDYFDYIPMPDGDLAVVIGDVCGHGFGPALVMAELRAYLRAFLLTRTDVGEIVRLLNHALAGDTDRFVTLLIAKLDPRTRSLVYAGAGHLPGYVIGSDGEVKARLESTGIPLAILPDSEYTTESAPPLSAGEMVLFLTDGIVEAHGPDENLFGTGPGAGAGEGPPRPAGAGDHPHPLRGGPRLLRPRGPARRHDGHRHQGGGRRGDRVGLVESSSRRRKLTTSTLSPWAATTAGKCGSTHPRAAASSQGVPGGTSTDLSSTSREALPTTAARAAIESDVTPQE